MSWSIVLSQNSSNTNIFCIFIVILEKSIIILTMRYVHKRYKKIEWKCRKVCIYLDKFKRYKFKMTKGLQRCLPNEHLDRKENDLDFFFWRLIILDETNPLKTFWIPKSLLSALCNNLFYSDPLLQAFNSINLLVNLSCPFWIFKLDFSFCSSSYLF